MKKTLSTIAVALLALTGCTAQADSSAQETPTMTPSSTPTESIAPAITNSTKPASKQHVVTYKVTAKKGDGTDAQASIFWSDPIREYADIEGDWEGMSSSFKSGDYAQVLVTPSDAGVDVQCWVYVDGNIVDHEEVKSSAGRAKCEYMLP